MFNTPTSISIMLVMRILESFDRMHPRIGESDECVVSKRCCIRLVMSSIGCTTCMIAQCIIPHLERCCPPHNHNLQATINSLARHRSCFSRSGKLVSACCLHHCLPEIICMARTHGKHIHLGPIGCHDLQWLILRGKGLASADNPN